LMLKHSFYMLYMVVYSQFFAKVFQELSPKALSLSHQTPAISPVMDAEW